MDDVYKRNSLRPHSRHCAGAGADRRCQSTPATNHCHCSALICQLASSAWGQMNWPRCSRRKHIHTPVPSQHTSLRRVPRRLANTYAVPSHGGRPCACCTCSDRPSIRCACRPLPSPARSHRPIAASQGAHQFGQPARRYIARQGQRPATLATQA